LDAQGWQDRITLEKDLASCEDELFFIMKAITTSQRRTDERALSQATASMRYCLSASDIVWHLMRDRNEPLVEFQLRNASYERTDHTDGSNHNLIEIERLYALNLLENAIYPQMIVPYMDHRSRIESGDMMLRVQWYMLEAVAGIPVLDQFEVNLFPLKVQLERELGKKLFEYIFPGMGSNAFESGGFSPFMVKHIIPVDEEDEGDDADDGEVTPDFVSTPRSQASSSTGEDSQAPTGPGSIELRLQPTLSLPDNRKGQQHPNQSRSSRFRVAPMTRITKDNSRLSPGDRPGPPPRSVTGLTKKKSAESIRALTRSSTDKTSSIMSGTSGTVGEPKKFSLRGTKKEQTDDLTQMMSRASNYMILANVKINDVVLCLSYKGRGERNIEDVHDFVFRLPVLEYRNKTWSNLELALRLKKDVIKALISHAPAILGNKFSHPRPTKQQQQRLRELATSSQILLPPSSNASSSLGISPPRTIASRNSHADTSGSSSLHQSVSSSDTYALGQTASYSSSQVGSREPSIMISEPDAEQEELPQRRSFASERPPTSRSIGAFSHDERFVFISFCNFNRTNNL
jgi:hypothetical protein